jgi:hypothetical protein
MHSVLTVLAALGMTAGAAASPSPNARAALLGSWRLVSNEEHRADGSVTAVWGRSPAGSLMYQANGRMAVQLMDPRRRSFASEDRAAGTAEEVKEAFAGYLAYFGSFRVDEAAGVVVHHVEGATFPNLIGTEQRRLFVLSGNRLTLTTPPLFRNGRTSTYVLVWEREP